MFRLTDFKKPFIKSNHVIVILAWVIINSFFLFKNGIMVEGEAGKYIDEANFLLQTGHLRTSNFWLYFTEIALLSFCIKTHAGFLFAIIIQLFFNLFATLYFHRTLLSIFINKQQALVGTLLLLLNTPYQEFNTFLQTESLFYSFTLILSCYILTVEKHSLRKVVVTIVLLAIVSITRPTGLLFIPPVFIYFFFSYLRKQSNLKKVSLFAFVCILFFIILNSALGSGGELDLMLPFRDERIICGVPTLPNFLEIKTAENGNSIYGLFFYITHNFSQFVRLALFRTFAFFGLYRNYYSTGHNIYLMIYFYTLLITAILSISYWTKNNPLRFLYLISTISLTWLTVILTCDDWHNRFYLSISPYVILMCVGFLTKFTKPNYE